MIDIYFQIFVVETIYQNVSIRKYRKQFNFHSYFLETWESRTLKIIKLKMQRKKEE